MKLNMIKGKIYGIAEIREILLVEKMEVSFEGKSKEELYQFIEGVLTETKYVLRGTKKKDKSLVFKFLRKVTGLGKTQLKRLVKIKKKTGFIKTNYSKCNKFKRKFTEADIKLLVKTDNAHNRRNGSSTLVNLKREYDLYGKTEYKHISEISVSHLYNLRNTSVTYGKEELTYTKTNAVQVNIGTRKKPNNEGKPGYLRVDSVHQGDLDKQKGVYYINIVDEVTQWEYVACVEAISEFFMYPVLLDILEKFPFKIMNFHSDNGKEYINKMVAEMLDKLAVQQTKSRSRHSNDNGLVESKNNSIIRKQFGYLHIPRNEADKINQFCRNYYDEYLNYHRVCNYPTKTLDERGKEKVTYPEHNTPFRKLISIPNYEIYLKPGITPEQLFANEMKMSDTEAGEAVQTAYKLLQTKIYQNEKGFRVSF
jgi:hypothetical protein